MVLIHMKRGTAVVDDIDAELASCRWISVGRGDKRYAARRGRTGEPEWLHLHREVAKRAGLSIEGLEVDHKDGDGMNCRRENLRPATKLQNSYNRGRNRNNKSGFKGVSWFARDSKWQAAISANGRQKHLGFYDTPEEAAKAYRTAAEQLHGAFMNAG
jgi:hypothetical protein